MARELALTLPGVAHAYPIRIGKGVLARAGEFLQRNLPQVRRVLLVCDANIADSYAKPLGNTLRQSGYEVILYPFASSESNKTLETLQSLYSFALTAGIKRQDAALALGGGITCDLTGFFAATYQRGIPFVQLPTTLLAQVDASVGGKTGVNWQSYKNFIGAFYQPHGVLIDTDTLQTLPKRDFVCGMAEVVKYALLEASVPGLEGPYTFFERINQALPWLPEHLDEIIEYCCRLKAMVVQADPTESQGIREILNLGHTFAHAYETLSEGEIPHGEAVSMGLVKVFKLAEVLGQLSPETTKQVVGLLKACDLPTEPPAGFSPEAVVAAMGRDKKAVSPDTLRLVLPYEQLGYVRVQAGISPQAVLKVL